MAKLTIGLSILILITECNISLTRLLLGVITPCLPVPYYVGAPHHHLQDIKILHYYEESGSTLQGSEGFKQLVSKLLAECGASDALRDLVICIYDMESHHKLY